MENNDYKDRQDDNKGNAKKQVFVSFNFHIFWCIQFKTDLKILQSVKKKICAGQCIMMVTMGRG